MGMIHILMMVALSSMNAPVQTAGIQPCVWPKCSKAQPVIAQIQTCIWPKCEKTDLLAALTGDSDIEVCVWPKKCAKGV